MAITGWPAPANAQQGPSFDCGKATTEIEKTICGNPDLAKADFALAEAYRTYLRDTAPDGRAAIKQDQLAWLRERDLTCATVTLKTFPIAMHETDENWPYPPEENLPGLSVDCLKRLYAGRLGDLQRQPPAENDINFIPARQPFLPRLVVDKNPRVCRMFARALAQDYASRQGNRGRYDGDGSANDPLPSHIPTSSGVYVLPWRMAEPELYSIDITGAGHHQAIYLHSEAAVSIHYLFTATLRAQFPGASDLDALDTETGWDLLAASINDFGPPFSIVWIDGQYFLMRDGNDLPTSRDFVGPVAPIATRIPPWGVALYAITPEGLGDQQCLVAAASLDYDGHVSWRRPVSSAQSDEPSAPISVALPATVGSYMSALNDAIGDSGYCEGTMWPGVAANLEEERRYLEYTMLIRPWEMTGPTAGGLPVGPYSRSVFSEIDGWSHETLFNYRAFRTLAVRQAQAVDELAGFYRDRFGVDEKTASFAAKRALEHLIVGSFTTPRPKDLVDDGDDSAVTYDEGGIPIDMPHLTLMAGTLDQVKGISQADISAWDGGDNTPHHEPLLFYALERVGAMRHLIDHGADVNKANWFGKTALMYAAQWNLTDAVRLLIASKANVNQTTIPAESGDSCLPAPGITKRTALMYAVENAQAPVIQALIDAGADRNAVDSAGHDMLWHLMKNQTLPPADRDRWIAVLSKP